MATVVTASPQDNNDQIIKKFKKKVQQEDILNKLNFKYENIKDNIKVFVPRRRLDINIEEDLIEEVGRLYGYSEADRRLSERIGSSNEGESHG